MANEQKDLPIEYFSISIRKFAFLSLFTIGFYGLYWFYRNWNIVKEKRDKQIRPIWRAVFSIFFCYPLCKRIFADARKQGYQPMFYPAWLAAGYILLRLAFWFFPDPWWAAGILSFIPLLSVQETINYANKKLNPRSEPDNTFTRTEIIVMSLGVLLLAMALLGLFLPG